MNNRMRSIELNGQIAARGGNDGNNQERGPFDQKSQPE